MTCDRPRRREEEQQAHRRRHRDRQRQHRLREPRRRVGVVATERGEHGDERGREAARHEDVEQQLRQDERGVVGVELRAGAVGAREDAVAHEARAVRREREDGEHDGAGRHVAGEQGAGPRDHVSSTGPGGRRLALDGRGRPRGTVRDRGARWHRPPVGSAASTAPDDPDPHRSRRRPGPSYRVAGHDPHRTPASGRGASAQLAPSTGGRAGHPRVMVVRPMT